MATTTVKLSRWQLLPVVYASSPTSLRSSLRGNRFITSVTLTGPDRDLLVVVGDGVDEAKLAIKLKKEVGVAEIVELRTLPPVAPMDMAVVALSPYHRNSTPGRSTLPVPRGGELGSQQAGCYCYTPSPHRYYPSSAAAGPAAAGGQGQQGHYGYSYGGGSNAHAMARGDPASYYSAMDAHARHGRRVGWWRRRGGKPSHCVIL
ncbi:hypothetical protein HU200_027565 [Digitaria exilis]|uniref:Uncharacterized protein n=1 Tax=Digitaria exilis TaxID=1010633 RepID=A0A835BXT5_9POAL|nr:hypothetical protein HU200_027565 [Digitaria exilis]